MKRVPKGFYGHVPPPANYSPAFKGQWIQIAWEALEPTQGRYDFRALDSAKQAVLNAGFADVRLRVMAGSNAPGWLQVLADTYQATDFTAPIAQTVVCWWKPVVADRYDKLMAALAAHIESDNAIIEVAASMTMSVFAEPFVRQLDSAATVSGMLAKGYTYALDQAAMWHMLQIHNVHFLLTRTGLACNPAENAETLAMDVDRTIQLQNDGRGLMGKKLILENNSLDGKDNFGVPYHTMYSNMQALGRPLAFQTRAYPRLLQPDAMITYAIEIGAQAVEPANNKTLTAAWTPTQAVAQQTRILASLAV